MSRSVFERIAESLVVRGVKTALKRIFGSRSESSPEDVPLPTHREANKVHPWRLCGQGRHWVTKHPLKVPVSAKNPDGQTIRDGHCADNPRRGKKPVHDYMDRHEIDAIARNQFFNMQGTPRLGALTEFEGSEKYDPYIQGWTRYWNEVLKPKIPLDPNVIKALIASESSFELMPTPQKAGKAGWARGLIQLTDQAIGALGNVRGEIKDHYIKISPEETTDTNMSICSGIRWLFQKQKLASGDLGREATWVEAVEKYKGILNKNEQKKQKELGQFYEKYKKLSR